MRERRFFRSCHVYSHTHLAVAIAASDTTDALAQADSVRAIATLVEYRLDLMDDFDLPALLKQSPLPAIITCRSPDQGGHFDGPERERRQILRQAIALKAPFVDVEWAALAAFAGQPRPHTKLIGSHHDFAGMIGDWSSVGLQVRALGADIVKLVGSADSGDDVLTPLAWLNKLDGPGIGIAMGAEGVASRILSPRFANAFLSFAAHGEGTASGQVQAEDLASRYGFYELAEADPLLVVLTQSPVPWATVDLLREHLAEHMANDRMRPMLAPVPVSRFGVGMLLALQLARVRGLICLPEVPRDPHLFDFGLAEDAIAWRLTRRPYPVLRTRDPEPEELMRFLLGDVDDII